MSTDSGKFFISENVDAQNFNFALNFWKLGFLAPDLAFSNDNFQDKKIFRQRTL